MLNPFILKKYAALMTAGLFTTIGFFIGVTFYGLMIGIAIMAVCLIVSLLIGNALLNNPFRAMLEGKGVLFLDINSTGIIRPFIMSIKNPYIEGMYNSKKKQDIFDRDMVYNLVPPQDKTGITREIEVLKDPKDPESEKVRYTVLALDEETYNRGRMGLHHFPVVIWNEQINSVLTKDMLSDMEKTTFAEHQILYLNRKVEELTDSLLNFGRYVVEQTRPLSKINAKTITVALVIIIIVVLIIFAPKFIPALRNAASGLGAAASTAAKTTGAITPTG